MLNGIANTSPFEINGTSILICPNPFSGNTTIAYNLIEPGFVNLEVYNVLGQKLETLVNTNQTMGEYKYVFSANEQENSSGVYYVKITINGIVTVKKIVGLR